MEESKTAQTAPSKGQGPIAWMVHNRVTPNLLMIAFLAGGLFMSMKIKKEVFPDFDLDEVRISVAYPGASPGEIEQGIVLAIEEAIGDIDGIEEINATASEGMATIMAELIEGGKTQKTFQDIKQEVDRIRTFPEEAEEPDVALSSRRRLVVSVVLFGEAGERVLRELAEAVRDRLLQDPGITQVELGGVRNAEVTISVSMAALRTYGLTLGGIAQTIRSTAVELPGGAIETSGGEILIRMKERRDWAREFAQIPIVTTASGAVLHLGEIAAVSEGFEESNRGLSFNGKAAMALEVYRVGDQTPLGVSESVRKRLVEIAPDLPPGIDLEINRDDSVIYRQRLELMLRNGFFGLLLVFALLGLFLEFKLAFWVTMGIPTSFLGAFLFLPSVDVSINMVSMFAFIIALGIVVDDAIIAGENIYEYRSHGMGFITAAIRGAQDVAVPISFSILTNIVAFSPLYFIPGQIGRIFQILPLVVCSVFVISWVEALFVLPSHVAHAPKDKEGALSYFIHQNQQRFSLRFSHFIENGFGPFLDRCLRNRYVTVALGLAFLMIVLGYAVSGRLGFILFPKIEADQSVVTAVLPFGSPMEKAISIRDRLVETAESIVKGHGGAALNKGVRAEINENRIEVIVYLRPPDIRPISTAEFTQLWRKKTGALPGLESLRFESDRGGPGRGPGLTVELSHRNVAVLEGASARLAEALGEYSNVKDIDDGLAAGKQQLDFRLLPEGQSLGLSVREVANQVRGSFFGVEALRQQRGRNEIKVMVRLPEAERVSEYDIEQLLIRTPSSRDVPLMQVAEVARGRAYTTITRHNNRRTVAVTGNVVPIGETNQVLTALRTEVLPDLVRDHPGLSYSFEGRQAEMRKSLQRLGQGFVMAMMVIFFLLAIPFRSYSQPAIVMMAIPFGIVGAVIGHMIMGYNLSVISVMGIVALSGVVVNDALVMIEYANGARDAGQSPLEAIRAAGVRRFRPILLTTLTTFGGLAPMIFETSRQARFIIPMAISLGYGILFATAITLVLIPCLYLILGDIALMAQKIGLGPGKASLSDKEFASE
ncbi:MAG: efflux RND transporter permease subunit [Nitrospiria bacterium]